MKFFFGTKNLFAQDLAPNKSPLVIATSYVGLLICDMLVWVFILYLQKSTILEEYQNNQQESEISAEDSQSDPSLNTDTQLEEPLDSNERRLSE